MGRPADQLHPNAAGGRPAIARCSGFYHSVLPIILGACRRVLVHNYADLEGLSYESDPQAQQWIEASYSSARLCFQLTALLPDDCRSTRRTTFFITTALAFQQRSLSSPRAGLFAQTQNLGPDSTPLLNRLTNAVHSGKPKTLGQRSRNGGQRGARGDRRRSVTPLTRTGAGLIGDQIDFVIPADRYSQWMLYPVFVKVGAAPATRLRLPNRVVGHLLASVWFLRDTLAKLDNGNWLRWRVSVWRVPSSQQQNSGRYSLYSRYEFGYAKFVNASARRLQNLRDGDAYGCRWWITSDRST